MASIRTLEIDEKALHNIHTLRAKLEEVGALLQALHKAGVKIEFRFSPPDDAGKQALEFHAFGPLNLTQ